MLRYSASPCAARAVFQGHKSDAVARHATESRIIPGSRHKRDSQAPVGRASRRYRGFCLTPGDFGRIRALARAQAARRPRPSAGCAPGSIGQDLGRSEGLASLARWRTGTRVTLAGPLITLGSSPANPTRSSRYWPRFSHDAHGRPDGTQRRFFGPSPPAPLPGCPQPRHRASPPGPLRSAHLGHRISPGDFPASCAFTKSLTRCSASCRCSEDAVVPVRLAMSRK